MGDLHSSQKIEYAALLHLELSHVALGTCLMLVDVDA